MPCRPISCMKWRTIMRRDNFFFVCPRRNTATNKFMTGNLLFKLVHHRSCKHNLCAYLSQTQTIWRLMLSQREAQSRNERKVYTNKWAYERKVYTKEWAFSREINSHHYLAKTANYSGHAKFKLEFNSSLWIYFKRDNFPFLCSICSNYSLLLEASFWSPRWT